MLYVPNQKKKEKRLCCIYYMYSSIFFLNLDIRIQVLLTHWYESYTKKEIAKSKETFLHHFFQWLIFPFLGWNNFDMVAQAGRFWLSDSQRNFNHIIFSKKKYLIIFLLIWCNGPFLRIEWA